jgi:hypothetical protein
MYIGKVFKEHFCLSLLILAPLGEVAQEENIVFVSVATTVVKFPGDQMFDHFDKFAVRLVNS